MNNAKVCIIILNWNSCSDTIKAIELLGESQWHITVVDNASGDPTEARTIELAHPGTTVLRSTSNLGYAGGMNLGLRWAYSNGFTHAILLNPDTRPSTEVLEAMIQHSEGYAVVGTAQVTENLESYVSAAQLNGSKPFPFVCETACGRGHDVDIVSGAGILVELYTAEELGYIDENFFHYKEEFDYCYRVKMSGRKIFYSCGVPLIHRRGGSLPGSSPSALYYSYRNELLFLRKHQGRCGWISGLGIFRNAIVAILKNPSSAPAILRGLFHGIRGISGPLFSLKTGRI